MCGKINAIFPHAQNIRVCLWARFLSRGEFGPWNSTLRSETQISAPKFPQHQRAMHLCILDSLWSRRYSDSLNRQTHLRWLRIKVTVKMIRKAYRHVSSLSPPQTTLGIIKGYILIRLLIFGENVHGDCRHLFPSSSIQALVYDELFLPFTWEVESCLHRFEMTSYNIPHWFKRIFFRGC